MYIKRNLSTQHPEDSALLAYLDALSYPELQCGGQNGICRTAGSAGQLCSQLCYSFEICPKQGAKRTVIRCPLSSVFPLEDAAVRTV